MKKLFASIELFLALFVVASCSSYLDKPSDTNLEFWITENVEDFDFSSYEQIPGWFGAREYYGKEYHSTLDEDDYRIEPDYYVKYVVSAYPDYSDGGDYITMIRITDPSIHFYGIDLFSPLDDFNRIMKAKGFEVETNTFNATKENITISVISETITIRADITNEEGIIF